MKSISEFRKIRNLLFKLKLNYYRKFWGMDLHPSCWFSLSVRFDITFPKGIHVGEKSYIAFDAAILSHDMIRGLYLHTHIGKHCFIGARSIILPGITIGDESVVAAGSVVTKDIPPRCIVAGNPATIIRENINVGPYGRFKEADDNEQRCRKEENFYLKCQ